MFQLLDCFLLSCRRKLSFVPDQEGCALHEGLQCLAGLPFVGLELRHVLPDCLD